MVFLSESQNKVVAQDRELATSIGLEIRADKHLPDIILADIGPTQPLLVFVEVVASDGEVDVHRREALLAYAVESGLSESQVCFVTAYRDRGHPGFRSTFSTLAWGSFAWFLSEPQHLIALHRDADASGQPFATLVRL